MKTKGEHWERWPSDIDVGEFCVDLKDECQIQFHKMEARFLICILRIMDEYSLPKPLKNHYLFIRHQVLKDMSMSLGNGSTENNIIVPKSTIEPMIREILFALCESEHPGWLCCLDMFSIVTLTLKDLANCMAGRLAPSLLEEMKTLHFKLNFERRFRQSIENGLIVMRELPSDHRWAYLCSGISYSVACLNCLYWLDDNIPHGCINTLEQNLTGFEQYFEIDVREAFTYVQKASELLWSCDSPTNFILFDFVDFVLDCLVELHNSKKYLPTKGITEALQHLRTSISDHRFTRSSEDFKLKGEEAIRRIDLLHAQLMKTNVGRTDGSLVINLQSIQDLHSHYSRREQKLMTDPSICLKWLEKHGKLARPLKDVTLELNIRLQYLQFILKRQPRGDKEFDLVNQTMKTIGMNIHEACTNAKYGRVDSASLILESQLASLLKDFDLRQKIESAHSYLRTSALYHQGDEFFWTISSLEKYIPPMSTQLAIEFIGTLLQNLKCLMSCRPKPMTTLKSQMEIFEVKLSFLRGFLTMMSTFCIKSKTGIIALVDKAACISYWCYAEKLSRNMEHEMSRTISELLSEMQSFEAEMRNNYLLALKTSHSSESDTHTPYKSELVVAIVDSLVDNFMELTNKETTSVLPKELRIETIRQDQSFFIRVLKDLRRQSSENMKFDDLLTHVKAQSDKMNQVIRSEFLDQMNQDVPWKLTPSLLQLMGIIKLIKVEFFLMDVQQSVSNSVVSWKDEMPILREELKALTEIAIDVVWQCDCYSRNVEALSNSFGDITNFSDMKNVSEYADKLLLHSPFELSVQVKLIKSEISLRKILKNQITLVDLVKDNFDNLLMDLEFLGIFLLDLPVQYAKQQRRNHLLSCVEELAGEINNIIESLRSEKDGEGLARRTELQLSGVLQKIEMIKAMDKKICPKIKKPSRNNFPMTDGLGFVDLLIENLVKILNFKGDRIVLLKGQIVTIQREIKFLREFLVKFADKRNEHDELRSLWEEIVGVAYEVEYAVDSYVANGGGMIWYHTLSDIIEDIKLIKERVVKISSSDLSDDSGTDFHGGIYPSRISSRIEKPTINEAVVGFEDVLATLKKRVIGGSSELDVITIFGMPGLGKTTLAKKLYDDCKGQHFDACAWCCVSEKYEKKSLLIDILRQNVELPENVEEKSEGDLADMLRKSIIGRRFLIFLDDIWTTEAWDDLRTPFPDGNQRSRIILTTRHAKVASYAEHITEPLHLRFFKSEESWILLVQKLFQDQQCPPQLVVASKRIAEKCQGLPLSVILVAGLLGKMEAKEDVWLQVAKNLSSNTVGGSNSRDIIELSYKHLPEYLKPCFLYFGGFREDEEISVAKLTWKWIAEGLIAKQKEKSLEDVAEEYLLDLIGRSLVMDAKMRYNGRVKSCQIHDLLHEFCRNKAKEEKFWQYVYSGQDKDIPNLERRRVILSAGGIFFSLKLFVSPVRSLLLHEAAGLSGSFILCFRLLKVLDLERTILLDDSFPDEIGQLIHLIYLAVRTCTTSIPCWIYKLENLETLLIKGLKGEVTVPATLWNMVRLRHVHINERAVFGFTKEVIENSGGLDGLETLSTPALAHGDDMEKMMRKFPNLKKLRCRFSEFCYYSMELRKNCIRFPTLDFLSRLESLKVFSNGKKLSQPCEFRLPENLSKLTLSNFRLPWKEISAIARLPNLEVLKLLQRAFEGETWKVEDDEFPALKMLKLDNVIISQWHISDDAFPGLEKLVLRRCTKLKVIPSCLSYNPTLQRIEVNWCSLTVSESAKQIQETQVEEMGKDGFKIFI